MKGRAYKKVERRLCPHCDQQLSLKTYKSHQRKFFDQCTNTWIHKQMLTLTSTVSVSGEAGLVSSDCDVPPPPLPPLAVSSGTNEEDSCDWPCLDSLQLESGYQSTSTLGLGDGQEEIEVWEDEDADTPPPIDALKAGSFPSASLSLVSWILFFVHLLRFRYGISDALSSIHLKFFKALFCVLGRFNDICKGVFDNLPGTLHLVRAGQNLLKNHIVRYVVCRKCSEVYKECDCTELSSHVPKSKVCSFVRFPKHVQARMHMKCGEKLLKSVELATGKVILYPCITYCYLSLKQSLQHLLSRPDFVPLCEQWRSKINTSGDLVDVYDGNIWREFQQYEGKPFLSKPLVFGLTMNVDWFQPYKHSTYSVGAIYMTVLNLPRSVRNKRENVILCGLTPGPSEPTNIHPFLKPLVDELLDFWDGIELMVNGQSKTVQCALLCIACNIPAGRKVCSFPSFTAHYACSRCKKFFGGTFGSIDHSGFNRDSWPVRTMADHRKAAKAIKDAQTLTAIEKVHTETGYHYSGLLNLPYLNASRMLIVDPLHNLFQGTAKRILKRVDW